MYHDLMLNSLSSLTNRRPPVGAFQSLMREVEFPNGKMC